MELTDPSALTYLTEGGAHVVYAIDESIPLSPTEAPPSDADIYGPSTPPPTELPPWAVDTPDIATQSLRKVVRLRKAVAATAPPSKAEIESRKAVRPRFPPANVLYEEQGSVTPTLLEHLNASLKAMETMGARPAHRRGVYLRLDQKHASVQEDMRARPGLDRTTLELKPKWLVQSLYAPADARRCRTCALHAMRQAARGNHGQPGEDGTPEPSNAFCPLDLVSESELTVRRIAETLLSRRHGMVPREDVDVLGYLGDFLIGCDALCALRNLQKDFTPRFQLQPGGSVDSKTLWAMTLRDCTLFIRVSFWAHAR